MRHQLICLALTFLSLPMDIPSLIAQTRPERSQKHEMIFIDWVVEHDLVLDLQEGQLRLRKPEFLPASASCYLIDGLKFCVDLQEIESNYKTYAVENKLVVRDDALYYDGKLVSLPPGVQMRNVWQAVLWKGWVICLGRTSETDKPAKMIPPFFATELITFNASERVAKVKYLSFNPPAGTRLYILSPK